MGTKVTLAVEMVEAVEGGDAEGEPTTKKGALSSSEVQRLCWSSRDAVQGGASGAGAAYCLLERGAAEEEMVEDQLNSS